MKIPGNIYFTTTGLQSHRVFLLKSSDYSLILSCITLTIRLFAQFLKEFVILCLDYVHHPKVTSCIQMFHVWFGLVHQERRYMDELWAWQRFGIWTIQNFGMSRHYNEIMTNTIFCIVISESTTFFGVTNMNSVIQLFNFKCVKGSFCFFYYSQ